MPFRPEQDVPLAPFTSLELGGPARFFAEIDGEDELKSALEWANSNHQKLTVFGGGSNLVVGDDGFDGLVLRIAPKGIKARKLEKQTLLRVGAGETWEQFVATTVEEMQLTGLECLAGIPGLVGATPIQNVGAYGTEVSHSVQELVVFDRNKNKCETWQNKDCKFAYRNSIFKSYPDRFVILEVSFLLGENEPSRVRYQELAKRVGDCARPKEVMDAVLQLRRSKSMVLDAKDPNRRSAGSFFTHPIVGIDKVEHLRQVAQHELQIDADQIPVWPYEGKYKIPAGWLIEKTGFHKGTRRGAVGISSKHALALVHHGGGTTAELLAFAQEIQRQVMEVFGIPIHPEPRIIGYSNDI